MRTPLVLLAVTSIAVLPLRGEPGDSSSAGRLAWFAYPYAFYTPETNLAFGAGAVLSMRFSDRPNARPSSLNFSGYYSINDQFDLTLVPEVYLNDDRLLISGKINGGKVIERMFGIGPTTPDIANALYDADYFGLSVRAVSAVEEHIKVGAVFGLNLYSVLIGQTPPFYEYALLGNDRVMRGYIQGRYRDHVYTAVQGEYRRRIWWRFGGVLFAGVGDVAPSMWEFQIKYIKPTYGAGLRFSFDEEEMMDLRMDVGFGRGTSGVYFAVNQAF